MTRGGTPHEYEALNRDARYSSHRINGKQIMNLADLERLGATHAPASKSGRLKILQHDART
ncbi:MAG TPA: hypothetical protein DEF45_18680 [Rhodopirellula sp.]|nr:hypothetical protein [Rhodopirellula sp.]